MASGRTGGAALTTGEPLAAGPGALAIWAGGTYVRMYRDISFHFVLSCGNAIATYSRVVAPWSPATWRTSSVRRSLNTTRRLVSCCPGSKVIGRSIRSTSSCITDLTAHRPRLSVCADRNEEDDSGGG